MVDIGVRPGPEGIFFRGWMYGCKDMVFGIVRPRDEAAHCQKDNDEAYDSIGSLHTYDRRPFVLGLKRNADFLVTIDRNSFVWFGAAVSISLPLFDFLDSVRHFVEYTTVLSDRDM